MPRHPAVFRGGEAAGAGSQHTGGTCSRTLGRMFGAADGGLILAPSSRSSICMAERSRQRSRRQQAVSRVTQRGPRRSTTLMSASSSRLAFAGTRLHRAGSDDRANPGMRHGAIENGRESKHSRPFSITAGDVAVQRRCWANSGHGARPRRDPDDLSFIAYLELRLAHRSSRPSRREQLLGLRPTPHKARAEISSGDDVASCARSRTARCVAARLAVVSRTTIGVERADRRRAFDLKPALLKFLSPGEFPSGRTVPTTGLSVRSAVDHALRFPNH